MRSGIVSLILVASLATASTYYFKRRTRENESTQVIPLAIINIWGSEEEITEEEFDNITSAASITIANSFPHSHTNKDLPEGIEGPVLEEVNRILQG